MPVGTDNIRALVLEVLRDALMDEAIKEGFIIKPESIQLIGDSITMPEYYTYIDSGRKKGAKAVPFTALVKWIKKKNFTGDVNKLAFAIQKSIRKKGIKPRPFIMEAIDVVEFSVILDEIEIIWQQ